MAELGAPSAEPVIAQAVFEDTGCAGGEAEAALFQPATSPEDLSGASLEAAVPPSPPGLEAEDWETAAAAYPPVLPAAGIWQPPAVREAGEEPSPAALSQTAPAQGGALEGEALCQALATLDTYQKYLLMSTGSVLLSYEALNLQREKLCCPENGVDSFPVEAAASLLELTSLYYFYQQSREALCKPDLTPAACRKNQLDYLSNVLVFLSALIRFGLLMQGDVEGGLPIV